MPGIHVDLTGSAASMVGAVDSAVGALNRMERQAESAGVATKFMQQMIVPAATAIASAFAASRALDAFSESNLPGAKAYTSAVDGAKKAVTALAAAVGEYLAPGAIKLANFIKSIAEPLTGLVRRFTAFSQSAGEFLSKLGSNAMAAFRTILPTIDAVIKKIEAFFSGPATDWGKVFDSIRQRWNETWEAILNYTAPIVVALAGAVEASFRMVGEMAVAAFDMIKEAVGSAADLISSLLPASIEGAGGMFEGLGATIQDALVTSFAAAEYAMIHWREVGQMSWTAMQLGAEVTKNYIVQRFFEIGDNLKVIWSNAGLLIDSYINYAEALFEPFVTNLYDMFVALFNVMGELFDKLWVDHVPEVIQATVKNIKDWMITIGEVVKTTFDVVVVAIKFAFNVILEAMKTIIGPMTIMATKLGMPIGEALGTWLAGMDEAQKQNNAEPDPSKPKTRSLKEILADIPNPFANLPAYKQPDLQALPGFEERKVSTEEKSLRGILSGHVSSFMGSLNEFLTSRVPQIWNSASGFIATLTKGLPNVIAKPAPEEASAKKEEVKRSGLAMEGSREAYKAILAAQGEKNMHDLQKQQLAATQQSNAWLAKQAKAMDDMAKKPQLSGVSMP